MQGSIDIICNDVTDRFMLFAGEFCYPSGGIDDLIGLYGSSSEAMNAFDDKKDEDMEDYVLYQWAHIYDIDTKEIVKVHLNAHWFDSQEDANDFFNY